MKRINRLPNFLIFGVLFISVSIVGCSSSEETTKEKSATKSTQISATELMQKDLKTLREEKAALEQKVSSLERENRTATARAAELETQLTEIKERLTKTPPPLTSESATRTAQPTDAVGNQSYDQALQSFKSRNYQEAASSFQAIIDGGAASDIEDNCHYWLGECAYGLKNYSGAIEHFQKVLSYATSEKKDDAQMMVANSYFALGDKAKAKAEYQKLIEKFPASPYVARAKVRLGKL